MLIVLSPAKTLDYETPHALKDHTQPCLLKDSTALIKLLREKSEKDLGKLMDISPKLAALNAARYQSFKTPFTPANARQALLAFKGDVYEGIAVENYKAADFAFAQEHVRILSGLYGLLRPLDLIQPYRLEMGTALKTAKGKNLYEFWGTRITEALNEAMAESKDDILLNLASEEYFKAVHPQALKGSIVHVSFKERKGNKLQVIGLMAKKARGLMTSYVVQNRLTKPEQIKKFDISGYCYDPELSRPDLYTFIR